MSERFPRKALRGFLRDDENGAQIVQHQRIRRRRFQPYRQWINDLLAGDLPRLKRERARRILDRRLAIERPSHILCRQIVPIVKLNALSQPEFPRRVVDETP